MSNYSFKFRTILNIREQIESNIKNELAAEITYLNKEEELLNNHMKIKEFYIDSFKKENSCITDINQIVLHYNYIKNLQKRINNQAENVNKIHHNVDKVREKLIKASKEKKILLKLKEKEIKDIKYENLLREQKINDEILSFKSSKQISIVDR